MDKMNEKLNRISSLDDNRLDDYNAMLSHLIKRSTEEKRNIVKRGFTTFLGEYNLPEQNNYIAIFKTFVSWVEVLDIDLSTRLHENALLSRFILAAFDRILFDMRTVIRFDGEKELKASKADSQTQIGQKPDIIGTLIQTGDELIIVEVKAGYVGAKSKLAKDDYIYKTQGGHEAYAS